MTNWKRPWCWERLKAEEGDNRGWDGWMASLTQWTPVWVNSGSWWWTGRPGVLQSMGSQRVGHDWATELNWTEPPDSSPFPYLGPTSAYSVRIFIGVAKKPAFSASNFKKFRHTSNSRNTGPQILSTPVSSNSVCTPLEKKHVSLSQNSLVSPRHKR